jgi:hypothetical protein
MKLPEASTPPGAPTEMLPTEAAFPTPEGSRPDAMTGVDPFALWAATTGRPPTLPPASGTSTRRPQAKSNPGARPRPAQQDRRKLLKLLAVGTVGVVTMVTVGGISFARAPLSATQSPSQIDDDQSEGSTSIDAHRERVGRRGLGEERKTAA